jgi:hypothetical protein
MRDEGEEWIVLEVGWEAKEEEVVVWYYRADCQKGEEGASVALIPKAHAEVRGGPGVGPGVGPGARLPNNKK